MTMLPSQVGRYRIQAKLAQGGMGVLYLGFDPFAERPVALKVLRVDNADMRDRFLHEARLAARLQHPNIITVFDVGAHEGQPFIAMEFIEGDTLAALIGQGTPLPLGRIVSLVQQICQGLGYAHRHGIVHRDIKPANLMVSRDSGVLKILDFGVAGRVDAEGRPSLLMGTPNYMSPEQVVGEVVDQRSDIFSVGLVLYELLCCQQAFTADTQQGILLKILHESPAPLIALLGLDPAIPAIVNRALEKDRERRYADLDSMRSDLSRVAHRLEMAEASRVANQRRAARRGLTRTGQSAPPAPPPIPDVPPERVHGSRRAGPGPRAKGGPPRPVHTGQAPVSPPEDAADETTKRHDLLAAAERDAYEGRVTTAIRKLERSSLVHPEIDHALAQYRAALTERGGSRGTGAVNSSLGELVRGQVSGLRDAIASGRWAEAADLLVALEQRLPDRISGPATPVTAERLRTARAVGLPEELAHYLARARQRLDAGDVPAALALVDTALGLALLSSAERPPRPRDE